MPIDPALLFARAEAHFGADRLEPARADLRLLLRMLGEVGAVLHLLGLVEKKAGQLEEASRLLARAERAEPGDSQVANNHGNTLRMLGRAADAIAAYDRALSAAPGFAPARLNRAILLREVGRIEEARADLHQLLTSRPDMVGGWNALGALERDAGRLAEAARAFDRALALVPDHAAASHGRARVALERGEADAAALFARARALQPDSGEVAIGEAEALEAAGATTATERLSRLVKERPGWVEGQRSLARMRWEAGDGVNFTADLESALRTRPRDPELHQALVEALAGAGLHDRAADAAAAAHAALRAPAFQLLEAVEAGMAGDLDRAASRLRTSPQDLPGFALQHARHLIRTGDLAQAPLWLDRARQEDSGSVTAWALTGIAWRLTGDVRAEWLHGQPGLFARRPLGLPHTDLNAAVRILRGLHVTRAQPIGQSVRGGTQTRGRLFDRSEPEIVRVKEAVIQAIESHRSALPPPDDGHPLLRHRAAAWRLGGSWSVRLTGGGHHVAHIHPDGILSSACHLIVPQDGDEDGTLVLGAPPADLGVELPPLASFAPEPGSLVLFPSILFHGTRPFVAGERLTFAFDVIAH